jgi:signal transduction histidine kinase
MDSIASSARIIEDAPGPRPARIDRAHTTTKPEGMGMGLAICRSIVAAHGGRLWFTRAEVGTIFHFSLPLG